MTHLEKLTARYTELQLEIAKLEQLNTQAYKEEKVKSAELFRSYFKAEEGDIVECTSASINVRKNQEGSWPYITFYVNEEWRADNRFTGFYINNSSFRTDDLNEWTLDHFQRQAHYTSIALKFQDEIMEKLNEFRADGIAYAKELIAISKPLQKEASNIFEEIESIKKEATLKALTSEEGLMIEGTERTLWNGEKVLDFPELPVKFDWTIKGVRGIRLTKVSTSGKSANIVVKILKSEWNKTTERWEDVLSETSIDRVRMENIETFLRRNTVV